jgi:hypothetical protein
VGIKKVKAEEYTCDGCHNIQIVTDSMMVIGYSGLVAYQDETGGTGGVKFFACKSSCLERAIENAIEESYGK